MPDQKHPLLEGNVLLGTRGWDWPAWGRDFYPADMPQEWRLTFYNTQFQCVFVPADRWRGATEKELKQWAEDTHDQFLFLLEAEQGAAVPEALQDRALCISALDARITWFDGHSDLKSLAKELKDRRAGPLILLSRDGDLSQLERVRTLLGLLGLIA